MTAHTFLLCLDSVREWDASGKRTRWAGGPRQPTEREGHGWHRYEAISLPVTGERQRIIWALDEQPDGTVMARATTTSTFVAELPVDPTVGPWRFEAIEHDDGTDPGAVVTNPVTGRWAQTMTPDAGWLLTCYLQALSHWNPTPAPTPMFDGVDTADPDHSMVIAADYPVAIVPVGQLDWFVTELRRLPQDIALPVALRGAAAGHSWTVPQPVTTLGPSDMIRVLVSCGLTNNEIQGLIECGPLAMRTALQVATDHETRGHPWTETGILLRAPRPGGSHLEQIRRRYPLA